MSDESFLASRFWRWYNEHRPFTPEEEQSFRQEALRILVESVEAGEITSLDGIDSPLSQRIRAYHRTDDFEMNSHWVGSSQDWICPCCRRSKFHVTRLGNRKQILAKLVVHHDHMADVLAEEFQAAFEKAGTPVEQREGQQLVERIGKAFAAYEEVLICEDCNNADAEAKKLVASPRSFSFSIGQISRFIQTHDHEPHHIDAAIAQDVWHQARAAYELRMTLIRSVAHAAATDSHWYEPYARGMDAIPVLGHAQRRFGDQAILQWVFPDSLCDALGPRKAPVKRNLSRWRTVRQRPGRAPPDNFLAMLRSEEVRARMWAEVADDWHCPICQRSKFETVYVGEKGDVKFLVRSNAGRGVWAKSRTICNRCDSTLMSLKQEISQIIGTNLPDSYGFVSPEELASIILPRPHSPHGIRSTQAETLLTEIESRLRRSVTRR